MSAQVQMTPELAKWMTEITNRMEKIEAEQLNAEKIKKTLKRKRPSKPKHKITENTFRPWADLDKPDPAPHAVEPGVHLTYPLMVGTAKACDMERLQIFEDEGILYNLDILQEAANVNRLFVVTNSDGVVLACIIPQVQNWASYGFEKLEDWSPGILWVHPAVRRTQLGTLLNTVMEQFAIAEGQSHLRISVVSGAEPFWQSVGYVSCNEMADSITLVRQKFLLEKAILNPRKRDLEQFVKVLISNTDSDTSELAELAAKYRPALCKSLNSSAEIRAEILDCSEIDDLQVVACLTVYRDTSPFGVLEFATLDDGILEFKNTVCLPIPHHEREKMILAVHILPCSKTDSQQLSSVKLVHMEFVHRDEFQGALFTRKLLIENPNDRGTYWNQFPGPDQIRINAAIPRGLPGISDAQARRTPNLDFFFPKEISNIIGEYMSQYLPPIHDQAVNKYEAWSAELQPIF
jgi:hypothetical protein